MLKLYRQTAQGPLYWETWEAGDELVIHHGALGDTGETEILPNSGAARQHVADETEQRRSEGYREIEDEDHVTVVVQYRINGWGTEEDLRRRETVQCLLDQCLSWTGLGARDGSDWGSGTTNLYCLVVDRQLAVDVIVEALKRTGYLEGVTIASEVEDEPEVHWPRGFEGRFSY
jgi:hypothetical protein